MKRKLMMIDQINIDNDNELKNMKRKFMLMLIGQINIDDAD
jgi:hypothetical protein